MNIVAVEKIGQHGDGHVRVDGRLLHVPKVLPGETIELLNDRLRRVLSPSDERINAFCNHYDSCGGCKFQHWAPAPYEKWKRQLLINALLSKSIVTEVMPLIDAHGAGRRRVSLHVRELDGVWVAGFMTQKSHDLCAIESCPVLVPALARAAEMASAFGQLLGPCDVSLTVADNGLDVAVKATRSAVPRRLEALNNVFRHYGVLRLSINGELHGANAAPAIAIGRAHVALPQNAFLQATAEGERVLSELVCGALPKAKHVADLFCGIGPFALRLAEKSKVHAFDSDKAAISSLQTAIRNTQGIKPVVALVRDLFREPLTSKELGEFDAVVFDPPRAGAEAQAHQIANSKVRHVVAVACDVGSFSRDAAILVAGGYRLLSVTPVDQFKWTAHLEMLAVFSR